MSDLLGKLLQCFVHLGGREKLQYGSCSRCGGSTHITDGNRRFSREPDYVRVGVEFQRNCGGIPTRVEDASDHFGQLCRKVRGRFDSEPIAQGVQPCC